MAIVYASNSSRERIDLWNSISEWISDINGAWSIIGDMNCLLNYEDKLNGTAPRLADLSELRCFVRDNELVDLAVSGNWFTWSDKHVESNRIWCKLDRALVNQDFKALFPTAFNLYPEPLISDHCPNIIKFGPSAQKVRWFRFLNFWTKTDAFRDCLHSSWSSGCLNLFDFQKNLKKLKFCLKRDMKNYRQDMSVRVKLERHKLAAIQNSLCEHPDDPLLLAQEAEAVSSFRKILHYSFLYNCQRARVNWAKEGDINSGYFHAIIKGRRSSNAINSVLLPDNSLSFDPDTIKDHFVNHFKGMLNEVVEVLPVDFSIFSGGTSVNEEDCLGLVRQVSMEELSSIVRRLPNNKAAGPDGFSAEFFKPSWGICGADLLTAIRKFFRTGIMPNGINATYLALIPKVQNPSSPGNYRPISCCNLVYKIIAGILANRLKKVLPKLISDSQSAFVEGRNITDNLCLAQELVSGYARQSISSRCVLKVDIAKAFDRVNWSFLESILISFRFPNIFIKWVMACVSTASFSVLINGQLQGFFPSKRGLRQGCPLSPFLFTLVMEILARRLNNLRIDPDFSFHPRCKKINLSHLMFADDVMIFSKAKRESLQAIKRALNDFQSWSGLAVSYEKSSIIFGGPSRVNAISLAEEVGIPVGSLPFKYLGLPLDSRSLKISSYDQLVDRMTAKINAWEAKKLSYAGRLILVKHVLSVVSLYWMRSFIIPQAVLKKVNAICRNFLWSGCAVGSKHPISWKKVCQSTISGGLGIKNLSAFNNALNLTQVWNICLNKDSIWTRWIHSYFIQNGNFWTLEERTHLSWLLKKILKLRDIAKQCFSFNADGSLSWNASNGDFSVAGSYKILMGETQPPNWTDLVWSKLSAPKHSFCSWLAIQNRLLTKDIIHWITNLDKSCCWCHLAEESNNHIFFLCSQMQVIKPLLNKIGRPFGGSSWEDLLAWKISMSWRSSAELQLAGFLINAAVYEIWKSRNLLIFEGQQRHCDSIISSILWMLRLKIQLAEHLPKWKSIQSFIPSGN